MRIFYVTDGLHIGGGQLVNLDHVAALRRLGYDARLLIVRPDGEGPFTPQFPPGFEATPWQRGCEGLAADDIAVVGEMFSIGLLELAKAPARRVLHNQGPYYTFLAFLDLPAIRAWNCEAMILPSGVGADMLRRMGWDRGLHVVRPPLDPVFAPPSTPRQLRVAVMTRKRASEVRLIRGIQRSLRPDLNDVPWVEIANVDRAEVARRLAASEVFLATGQLEGLGLPPLEAMATGALVVGFHGGGAKDYATPDNGDWFDDDRHFEVAQALAAVLDRLKAGDRFEARHAAGFETAARYSQAPFEAALAEAWRQIAGPP